MLFDLSKEFWRNKFTTRAKKLIDAGKVVELTEKRKIRTSNQNSYFHAILSIYAIDTGYTLEEAKTVIKRELGLVYEKGGTKFLKSTKDLDTKEMAEFTERFRDLAAKQDIYLHSPEEFNQGAWVQVEQYIQQHKQNL